MTGNPIANPASVILRGQARFTVLTSRLIRLEWSGNGQFEERSSFAFPTRYSENPPPFTVQTDDKELTLDSGRLILRYRLDSGPFGPDNLSITLRLNGQEVRWSPGMVDHQNLRGTRRTLDECVGPAALEEGLLSRAGWALFDDSQSVVFGLEDGWVAPRPDSDLQDWYFFGYGHDYPTALHEYIQFGGVAPLVPRYVLGAWWSRYWAYSAQDLQTLVEDFARYDLPLDVLVLDMDWHTPDSWTGYTWNRQLFPDPTGFLKWVHDRGLRTTLNLHPAEGVQPFEDIYPAFGKALRHDLNSRQPVPFQITDREFVRHYFELLHHPLEEQGVDFWWMDWQQGHSSEMRGLDPLPWLNHLHFRDSTRRGKRAMLYSRWGKLGNHRYPIGFSGDTYVTWDALAFQPYFTATAANVGYGWWSHDIGGHMGGATEPELFARWVQFGALSPCLRLHATNDLLAERRPWTFPKEIFRAVRTAFQLRYQLVPYLYSVAREVSEKGLSLCTPMYYDFPEAEAAYLARDQYFLGQQMIAAPIVRPADPLTGLASVAVWIPDGEWLDFFTRESFSGPCWVTLTGDIERIPVLVKAGAIIPMSEIAATTDALPHNPLTLRLFPGAAGEFWLYEDDGISEAYTQGESEATHLTSRSDKNTIFRLEIAPTTGRGPSLPAERSFNLYFEGTNRPDVVTLDKVEISDWSYDPTTLTTLVKVPLHSKQTGLSVQLETRDSRPISALGAAHNQQVQSGEVRRLLGAHLPAVSWENLSEAVLRLDEKIPGRNAALTRLGGPLVHFVEYLTPEEAYKHLGAVVIGAPADGSPYKVAVNWQLFQNGQVEAFTSSFPAGSGDHLIYHPFGAEGQVGPAKSWSAEVRVEWQGAVLNYSYQSKPLFPAITPWQVVVYNEETAPLAIEQLFEADGKLNPALAWETYQQEWPALKNIADAFHVRLREKYEPRIYAGEKLAAFAVTEIPSPDEREVVFEFRSGGPIEFFLNGEPLVEAGMEMVSNAVFVPQQRPRVTKPVKLKPGLNRLVIASKPPQPRPYWWFSVATVSGQ